MKLLKSALSVMDFSLAVAQEACDQIMNQHRYSLGGAGSLLYQSPKIIAHRGVWGAFPENSLGAFKRAVELGAWGLECDIRFSKDDEPVIVHDHDLKRSFGHSFRVDQLTFSELRDLTKGKFGGILHLKEVVELNSIHLMLEVKTSLSERQFEIIKFFLKERTVGEDCHLLALSPALIKTDKAVPARAWILVGELKLYSYVPWAIEKKLAGVAGHYLMMRNKDIHRLHRAGLKVGVGQTPTLNLLNRELERGVDWVFTNSTEDLIQGFEALSLSRKT